MTKQPISYRLSALVAVAVAIGTAVVVLQSPPEQISATSQDGMVRLSGLGPSDVEASIEPAPASSDVSGIVYAVSVKRTDAPYPASSQWTLTMAYQPSAFAENDLPSQLLRFDTAQGTWIPHAAVQDMAAHTLTLDIEGDPSGLWTVGGAEDLFAE